jgi:hypothetical protein
VEASHVDTGDIPGYEASHTDAGDIPGYEASHTDADVVLDRELTRLTALQATALGTGTRSSSATCGGVRCRGVRHGATCTPTTSSTDRGGEAMRTTTE